MWLKSLVLFAGALVLGMVLGCAKPPGPIGPLPAGWHVDIVAGRCIICHSLEMVAQQRQDRAGWVVIVDRMATYGAPLQPEDRIVILDYLTKHLGP